MTISQYLLLVIATMLQSGDVWTRNNATGSTVQPWRTVDLSDRGRLLNKAADRHKALDDPKKDSKSDSKPGQKTDDKPDQQPDPERDTTTDEKPDGGPNLVSDIALNHEDWKYKNGDTLAIRFQMEADGYVYLLYELTDGNMVMLFPNRVQPDCGFAAQETVTLPPDGKPMRFRIGPPFGEEKVVLLVTTEPVAELDALDLSSGRAIPIPGDALEKLEQRVKNSPEKFCIRAARIVTAGQ